MRPWKVNTSNRGHNSIHDVHSGLKSDRLLSVLPVSTYCCMHGTQSLLICILAFSRHNSRMEGLIKNPRVLKQEKPKMNPYVCRRNERCWRWSGNRHTSTHRGLRNTILYCTVTSRTYILCTQRTCAYANRRWGRGLS